VQSREHVFIAQLLLHAWNKGEDLDLAQLIGRIQVPPIRTVGAFDVETFYPEKDRLKLALALNNLLASPSFATWIEGDPLDLSVLTRPDNGKPRNSSSTWPIWKTRSGCSSWRCCYPKC